MIKAFEKLANTLISGREYSPGLIINLTQFDYLGHDDGISVAFSLDNVGNVPYNLYVVGLNLATELEKIYKYLGYEELPRNFIVRYHKQGDFDYIGNIFRSDIPEDEIIHITKEFKSILFENLSDITTFRIKNNAFDFEIGGKFLPRMFYDRGPDGTIDLHLYFRLVSATNGIDIRDEGVRETIESNIYTDLLYHHSNAADGVLDAILLTENNWEKNFFLLDNNYEPDYDLDSVIGVHFHVV